MTPAPTPEALLAAAVRAAQTAGKHAVDNIGRRRESTKTFAHDVKLMLDRECQEIAIREILAVFPTHAILGEEDDAPPGCQPAAPFRWVIDPIDGTVNFSHGLPQWCCSIAAQQEERTVAAAVYAPVLDELYTARIDGPAFRNGTRIHVSDVPVLAEAIVLTGLDKNVGAHLKPLALFERIALQSQKARILGSAALDICTVACGRADGYFESGIYIWDIAAAELIVRQAGGRAGVIGSMPGDRLMFAATNAAIYDELVALVGPAP